MFLTLSSYDWSQLPNNSYHVWGVLCKYYTIESLLDISITTVIQSANMIRRKHGRTRTALNITASEVTILLWTLRTWLVIILSALLSVGPSAILGTIKQYRVIFQIKFKNVFCFFFLHLHEGFGVSHVLAGMSGITYYTWQMHSTCCDYLSFDGSLPHTAILKDLYV